MKYYTIYKIVNLINEKYYIGKHETYDFNDDYMGSGLSIKRAIKKYGKDNFKKEILFVYDNIKEMNDKEKEILTIDFIKENRQQIYNIQVGGTGGDNITNHPNRDEINKKRGNSLRGKKRSEETKRKMSLSMKGRRFYGKDNHFFGKKHTEESLRKNREAHVGKDSWMKGKKHSEESKRIIKEKRKMQVFSEESMIKKSNSMREYHRKRIIMKKADDMYRNWIAQ